MLRPTLLAALLLVNCATYLQAQTAPPPPPGPFPETGTFCGLFQLCTPELVTRADS